jgi:hypothetical protein
VLNRLPQDGETVPVNITRIEQTTAAKAFKSKTTGKYEGKYGTPTDPVYIIYGQLEGSNEEQRLGTITALRSRILIATPKLYQILIKAGFDPSTGATIDGLHELKGRTIQSTLDE